MKKERIIGLDIFRIFSMFGIIGLHVIINGGIINNLDFNSLRYQAVLVLLIVVYTSVDSFAILSGYLNIDKEKNKAKRIIELLFITLFWCVIIAILFYSLNLVNIKSYGKENVITNFIPLIYGRYWYLMSYVFVFFMMPYINRLCKALKKEEFKKLLITVFILLSIVPCLLLNRDLFKIVEGFSPFWLIYCYMIGAYLKLHGIKISRKKIIIFLVLFLFLTYIVKVLEKVICIKYSLKVISGDWFMNYISPTTLIVSILFTLLFSKININKKITNRIIVYLSNSAFSVYIIHSNKIIYDYILRNLFIFITEFNPILIILSIICLISMIYIICAFLDELRKLIFKIYRVERMIDAIGDKIDELRF